MENENMNQVEEMNPVDETELVEVEASNGGLLIGAGLGVLATLGTQWVYKKAIKPGVGKIKDKIAARKAKKSEAADDVCDSEEE